MDTKLQSSRLEVTVMFEPTRVARDTLHDAYTLLLPGGGVVTPVPPAGPAARHLLCAPPPRPEGRPV